MKRYFITGIGTGVGKTIVSAILVEALEADYWKPIQTGNFNNSDTITLKNLVSNSKSYFHSELYRLKTPASPHIAAKLDNIFISLDDIKLPQTDNHLIIEGAGGLMVPLNNKGDLMIDLIKHFDAEVILVSRNYLGSINHTLLSVEVLRKKLCKIKGIIFNGEENQSTENFILQYSNIKCLGKIRQKDFIDKEIIRKSALILKKVL